MAARQLDEFSRFEIEEIDTLRVQPCVSPVWDTAIAAFALLEANTAPADIGLQKATQWLLQNQILGGGDWQIKNRDAEPGGWAFEFRNESWFDDEIFDLLKSRNVALCLADADTIATPKNITADYGYLRLRREDYTGEDVKRWSEFVREQGTIWSDAFIYFKHEESGTGPKLARQMTDLLDES